MKVFLILIAVLLTTSAFAQTEGWYQQTIPTSTASVSGVYFLDRDTGWAGSEIGLFRTYNGGQNWDRIGPSIGMFLPQFINSKYGWAIQDGQNDKLFRTTDGGETWIPFRTGVWTPFGFDLSNDTVQIISDGVTSILLDSGNTAVSNNTTDYHEGKSISCIDSKHAIIVGGIFPWADDILPHPEPSAMIAWTNDGFNFYRVKDSISDVLSKTAFIHHDLYGVYAFKDSFIIAVGTHYIGKSINHGKTWQELTPDNFDLTGHRVMFSDARNGIVTANQGKILRTIDGGESWTLQNSKTTNELRGLFMLDSLTAWVTGAKGTLLHTTDAGKTWVMQNIPKPLTTSVTPEPFSRKTSISYELPSAAKVKIHIYDILGKELEVLESPAIQDAGTHTIEFDGSRYPEGTFHYQIETDGFYGTGKMTKVVY